MGSWSRCSMTLSEMRFFAYVPRSCRACYSAARYTVHRTNQKRNLITIAIDRKLWFSLV